MKTKLIQIDSELHKKLKRHCQKNGYTMLGLLNYLVRDFFKNYEATAEKPDA